MLTTTRPATEDVAAALAEAERLGVTVEPWLDQGQTAGTTRTPVLYLVATTAASPVTWSPLEDWVRMPSDAPEIRTRVRRLAQELHPRPLHARVVPGRLGERQEGAHVFREALAQRRVREVVAVEGLVGGGEREHVGEDAGAEVLQRHAQRPQAAVAADERGRRIAIG